MGLNYLLITLCIRSIVECRHLGKDYWIKSSEETSQEQEDSQHAVWSLFSRGTVKGWGLIGTGHVRSPQDHPCTPYRYITRLLFFSCCNPFFSLFCFQSKEQRKGGGRGTYHKGVKGRGWCNSTESEQMRNKNNQMEGSSGNRCIYIIEKKQTSNFRI